MARQVPILRILGGLFFVLAGAAYYLGVTIASSISLVFIAAGAAVLLLVFLGHRASGADVAIFVIGLLVLGVFVTPGLAAPGAAGGARVTHTVARSQFSAQQIDLLATTDVGSVSVTYSAESSVGYQVNFTRAAFPFSLFSGLAPSTSLTNETRGGVLVLNATARAYDISVAIGTGYSLNITASSGTGSVNVASAAGQRLGNVSLQSGTGEVKANLTSLSAGAIYLQTGTGSVELYSNHLVPDGPRVPMTLQTGTGSVDLKVRLVSGTAASVDASTGFGGVTNGLHGFVVSSQSSGSHLLATAGDVDTAAASFVIRASTGTGSVTVEAQYVPGA